MKNLLKILFVLLLLMPISFAQQNSERSFAYMGYVEIEEKSIDSIKASLESNGCHVKSISNGCYYIENTVYEEPENSSGKAIIINSSEIENDSHIGIRTLSIHPNGASFGGDSITLTERHLYYFSDMKGDEDIEKYKNAVRSQISTLGNFVKIKEDTWNIQVDESTGRVYAAGSKPDNLADLIKKVEFSHSVSENNYAKWIISILALIIVIGIAIFAYTRLRKN